MNGEPEFGARRDSFSEMRRNLEASVLPLATSVDGRRFSLQASLDGLQFQAGSYVVLDGRQAEFWGKEGQSIEEEAEDGNRACATYRAWV